MNGMGVIMLEVKNLSKKYIGSDNDAIKNFNIKIEDGKICALFGRNGAGKTTVLKCASGVLNFNSGDILINKKSLKKNSLEYKKSMAYIPDSPDIYEYLKGVDYLNFIGDIYRVEDRDNKIKKYSDIFELTGFLGNTINTYSNGMRERLLIIASLIHQPQVLLLDEPFNYLDSFWIKKLKEVLKKLASEKVTILYSTNKISELKNFCDKVAFLDNGILINYGDYKDLSKELIERMGQDDE